jgi:hypothetical protein
MRKTAKVSRVDQSGKVPRLRYVQPCSEGLASHYLEARESQLVYAESWTDSNEFGTLPKQSNF